MAPKDRCRPLDSFALLRRAREPRVDPAERHLPASGRPRTQQVNGSTTTRVEACAVFAQFLIGAGRPRDRGAAGGVGARGRRTALHRTPIGPHSLAIVLVSPTTPALAAA